MNDMTIEIDEIKSEERLVIELLNTAICILKRHAGLNIGSYILNVEEVNDITETRYRIKQRIDVLDSTIKMIDKTIRIME